MENEFKRGEILTETKEEGTELHDELIPTKSISKEKFVELVSKKKPSYAILGVWGMLGDIRLLGQPDHMIWSKGNPIWLVELKTTSGDPAQLWDDQYYQILIYGALLEKMGFDCSTLNLALIRLKANQLSDQEKRTWITRIAHYLEEGKINQLETKLKGLMKAHLIKHDVARAEAAVRSKQGYWLGQRGPTSSLSVGRCRACEYHEVCEKSLYKET